MSKLVLAERQTNLFLSQFLLCAKGEGVPQLGMRISGVGEVDLLLYERSWCCRAEGWYGN